MPASRCALDDPATTTERRRMLREAGYLRWLYEHWYSMLAQELPAVSGEVLELGSGGGFLESVIPGLRTSDVMPIPGVELIVDARSIPFGDATLRAIVGTNVLHHIPDIARFLGEAQRALVPGGRLVFIEPWPTPLSIPIYRHVHHEPFELSRDWSLPAGGPLTAANGALPWIVFRRDRAEFERRFPSLVIRRIESFMPLSYLLSGGIGRAWPIPAGLFRLVERLERPLGGLGLFARIVVERQSSA